MKERLRMSAPRNPFHIALVNPEIPQNTGNIGRLCAATGSVLHLVGKLGFRTDEKAVRRAGLDYWHLVKMQEHETLEACLATIDNAPAPILLSTGGEKSYVEAPFEPGSVLVFGAESVGLPQEILSRHKERRYGIPTCSRTVRSLNLGNSVALVLYHALHITGALEEPELESDL